MNLNADSPIKTEIPPRERLIFALDVPDLDRARDLINHLGDSVVFYKLGLEFFLSGHYFELAEELRDSGKKIFADLKLFDIPATVASAVRQLARHEVNFCTVHGNDGMLRAAAEAKGDMQILAVTALTSLDQGDPVAPRLGEPGSGWSTAGSRPDHDGLRNRRLDCVGNTGVIAALRGRIGTHPRHGGHGRVGFHPGSTQRHSGHACRSRAFHGAP